MKEINELLKKYNIKYHSFYKNGKCFIIDNKYVVKKNKTDIYEYLIYRNFKNFPKTIIDSGYEIKDYIEDINIPKEQQMIDLIILLSSLHKKTTYYKKISEFNIKDIYENIKNKIIEVNKFYDEQMILVETSIYMRPSYYLLARNISNIYVSINECNKMLDDWYKKINELGRIRVSVIHNNLKLEHFINNNLISWDYSKVGIPVFDLFKLYKDSYNEYDWLDLIDKYIYYYPLREEELELLDIIISVPNKIEFTNIEMDNVIKVNEELNYIKLTRDFILNKKTKYGNNKEQEEEKEYENI